ncbi:hypothetical protein pipiens_002599 [Culex pipiens pipiens]|uniref:Uncharacterized protein n=1 Tax=Culex pipiens pipiens TaxID=38569 RepID=A0ABD1DCJ0_CULPP
MTVAITIGSCCGLQSGAEMVLYHTEKVIVALGSLEATLPREMVSRRKILSRSRDDLNLDSTFIAQEEEEDVWYQKDKLYKVGCVTISGAVTSPFTHSRGVKKLN